MKQKVAVVVINFQSKSLADTLECLDSLAELRTHHEVTLYVVNHDSPQTKNKLKNHPTQPLIIESESNLGFAGHNNLGLTQAVQDGQEIFVLLNNDTTVDSHFLDPLVDALHDKRTAFVSPKIYFSPEKEFHADYKKQHRGKVIWYAGGIIDWQNMLLFHRGVDEVDRGQFEKPADTDFATGCCVAFRRDVLDTVGLMPQDYFMYFEDAAWCQKAQRHSLKSAYEPRSHIYHKNASSSGGSGSSFHAYYQSINRFRFAMQYAPLKTKLILIKQYFAQAVIGNEQERSISLHALFNKRLSDNLM